MEYSLTNPPQDERKRELWLQNTAGFIIIQNMRNYAINKIPTETPLEVKEKIIKGIDNTIYGLMMIMDGVTGTLENENYLVRLESKILLEENEETIQEINTLDSDGMCMGFHGWKEGDFGKETIYTIEE